MSNNQVSPLVSLLEANGYVSLIQPANYQYFNKLKNALTADNKSVMVSYITDIPAMFNKPLTDTDDLFQSEVEFIHALIENYSRSVVEPLVDSLNTLVDEDGTNTLTTYFDGDLTSCMVYFDEDAITDYVAVLDDDDLNTALTTLDGWKNTLDCMGNADELVNALKQSLDGSNSW